MRAASAASATAVSCTRASALRRFRLVDYTTVVTAQVAELASRQAALANLQDRLGSAVILIEALGGDWAPRRFARRAADPGAVTGGGFPVKQSR